MEQVYAHSSLLAAQGTGHSLQGSSLELQRGPHLQRNSSATEAEQDTSLSKGSK